MENRYYLIIICYSHGEYPNIYLLRESCVTPEMLERMNTELGDYPYWCLPSEGYPDEDTSLCDISEIGISVDCEGKDNIPHIVTKIFSYFVL